MFILTDKPTGVYLNELVIGEIRNNTSVDVKIPESFPVPRDKRGRKTEGAVFEGRVKSMLDFGTPGGGWIRLSVAGCVTTQTFVEIEGNIFFSFFSLLCEREVEENEEGQWNKEASCIFAQTRLSWKKQFSVSHRNFEHYTPRDGLQRTCLHG